MDQPYAKQHKYGLFLTCSQAHTQAINYDTFWYGYISSAVEWLICIYY